MPRGVKKAATTRRSPNVPDHAELSQETVNRSTMTEQDRADEYHQLNMTTLRQTQNLREKLDAAHADQVRQLNEVNYRRASNAASYDKAKDAQDLNESRRDHSDAEYDENIVQERVDNTARQSARQTSASADLLLAELARIYAEAETVSEEKAVTTTIRSVCKRHR